MSHAAGYTASYFRHRIEDHFEEQDLDVICRKQKHAYALYRADDQMPLAKIQRIGQGDEVRVWWWDDGRWRQTEESDTTLSLDKALEYITDDPDHYFFGHDDAEEEHSKSDDRELSEIQLGATLALQPHLAASAMFAGAVGGLASGPGMGVVWGVLVAAVGPGGVAAVRGRLKVTLKRTIAAGLPMALLAVPAATIGGKVHAALSGSAWGYVVGALAGALGALLMLQRPWCAWLLGAAAGIVAAEWLAELVLLREHFLGLLLIVFVASCFARFYAMWIQSYRHARELFQSLVDGEFLVRDKQTSKPTTNVGT